MAEPSPLVQFIDALVPFVVALIGFVFSWLTVVIRSKVKGEQARNVLLKLSELANDVVLELEQTVVRGLRAASADGRIQSDEAEALRALALEKLLAYLGTKGKAEALKAFGFTSDADLAALLRAKLEAEVAKARAGGGRSVTNASMPPTSAGA